MKEINPDFWLEFRMLALKAKMWSSLDRSLLTSRTLAELI